MRLATSMAIGRASRGRRQIPASKDLEHDTTSGKIIRDVVRDQVPGIDDDGIRRKRSPQ